MQYAMHLFHISEYMLEEEVVVLDLTVIEVESGLVSGLVPVTKSSPCLLVLGSWRKKVEGKKEEEARRRKEGSTLCAAGERDGQNDRHPLPLLIGQDPSRPLAAGRPLAEVQTSYHKTLLAELHASSHDSISYVIWPGLPRALTYALTVSYAAFNVEILPLKIR
jgi:hypothetical protein